MPAPSPSSLPAIHVDVKDAVACITLNRRPMNVVDVDTLNGLNDALRTIASSSGRVVLIRSGIPNVFSAGVDLRDHVPARLDALFSALRENVRLLLTLEAVTIAAVNRSAFGGGAELALLCDILMLADDATLSLPEISLAAFPPVAAALLPERAPWQAAMRLLLGEALPAATLRDFGVVAEVVSSDALHDSAQARARMIAGFSGVALRAMLAATRGIRAPGVLERLDAAIAIYKDQIAPSRDAQEGIDAFLQKRAPGWTHR